MGNKNKVIMGQVLKNGAKHIKVQLDARTVIILSNMRSLEFWKQRYPHARIIG